jgi:xylulokinase
MVGMGSIQPGMAIVSLERPMDGIGGLMITNHAAPGLWEAEGVALAAASSYRWLRDTLGTLEKAREAQHGRTAYEALNDVAAAAPVGSMGLLFLPYLATARTPRWNASACAAFVGLSFAHGRGEVVRAVLEGMVLEVRDIMESWQQAGIAVDRIRLGGGATKAALWNHIQADVYGRPVQTLKIGESTALGAAILGGVGAGIFRSIAEGVEHMVTVTGAVEPNMEHHRVYEDMYQAYVEAYEGLASSGAFRQAGPYPGELSGVPRLTRLAKQSNFGVFTERRHLCIAQPGQRHHQPNPYEILSRACRRRPAFMYARRW